MDLALGLEPWLTGDNGLCTYPMPWAGSEKEAPMTPEEYEAKTESEEVVNDLDLQLFLGSYLHPAFGTIHIERNTSDDHLHLKWGRLGRAKLYQIESKDSPRAVTFRCLWEGPYAYNKFHSIDIIFNETNDDGVVPALWIVLESKPDYFVRDSLFQDHDWTCPDIEGVYNGNSVSTIPLNSLSIAVIIPGIIYFTWQE